MDSRADPLFFLERDINFSRKLLTYGFVKKIYPPPQKKLHEVTKILIKGGLAPRSATVGNFGRSGIFMKSLNITSLNSN